jgi:pimeloyl-ACP methyl ester carboxylesterase
LKGLLTIGDLKHKKIRMIVVYSLGYIALGLTMVYLIFSVIGRYLLKKGQQPIDYERLKKDGGKYAETEDNRKVEYFVFGNLAPQSSVIICIHGSGPEAMSEVAFNEKSCIKLGLKGIAISLPGYGYTDMKPGRRVVDWPKEDLAAVLKQEAVDHFLIMGHSQGTVHAMAAAYYYPNRCKGLGLNAPLLPSKLSKEEGLVSAIGSDSLPKTETIEQLYMAWYFALMHLVLVKLTPWLPLKAIKTQITPKTLKIMGTTLKRSVIRGSVGGTYETAHDVCYDWGFDPRTINNKNICIWHASDDTFCPPELGKWLCDYYQHSLGIRVNFRADKLGQGHFTYKQGIFLEPEQSMIKVLMDGGT